MSAPMISPAQIRAARHLVGWRQSDLSAAAALSVMTIKGIERGAADPRSATLAKIRDAFYAAGVEFLGQGQDSIAGGPGVRLSRPTE